MSEREQRILQALQQMLERCEGYLNVPPEDGRMLRLLAQATSAQRLVEIGTSTGYSGLWFSLALENTGGHLTTFEQDAGRAAKARERFRQVGVDALITIIEGDAHTNVARLEHPIDLLFIDADKEGYIDYLDRLLPLVRRNGLILAHNTDMAPDYMARIKSDPQLESVLYTEGKGLAISLKL
jgi:predicted O-methyltransferase YrrM